MDRNADAEAEIYSAASEPARDDQGRFAQAEREPAPQETIPAEQERPTPNLGQLPDQGAPQGDQPQPEGQQAPQQDPRHAGILRDLQETRRQKQETDRQLAERDRQIAELNGAMRQMQAMFGQQQGRGQQPQAPQQPAEMPDPFNDPQGFATAQARQVFEQQFGPFAQQFQQREQMLSRQLQSLHRGMAAQQYGADAAKAAEEAFNTAAARNAIDPLEHQRIISSDNPFAAAVEWHRRTQSFERVGHDPDKWFETETQRRLREDPAFQQQVMTLLTGQAQQAAGAQSPAAGRPAPVFAGLPSLNAAPGTSGQQSAPISEADIFHAAPPKMGLRR